MADLAVPTKNMTPIEEVIRGSIRDNGPMPVSDYMALALGHPEHGYYRKSNPLGREGDFTTAPEITQVFGEIIGLWAVVTWQQAGAPSPFHLVELGPGNGTLMADALRAADAVPGFLAAADIHLVEINPLLRESQKDRLASCNVSWHESVDTVPDGPCLFIANEFFDALPVDQYVKAEDGWHIRCIDIDPATERLSFVAAHSSLVSPDVIPAALAQAPLGSLFEHCAAGMDYVRSLGQRIARDGVGALIIDYGHACQSAGETLQAVRNHQYSDVLKQPGNTDLTAHVDFEALSVAAKSAGAVPFGPISQGRFLSELGIIDRTNKLANRQDSVQANLLNSGCRRLIDAEEMGTLFKVLALTDGKSGIPAGFELWDGAQDEKGFSYP